MPGLSAKEKRENGAGNGGLTINLGGQLGDTLALQTQVQALQNQVGAAYDYNQPLNPLKTCAAFYVTGAGQSFNSGVQAAVNFDAKIRDTHNAVKTGTAWGFYAQLDGPHSLTGFVLLAASTAWSLGEVVQLQLYIDDAGSIVLDRVPAFDTSGGATMFAARMNANIWLARGQKVDVRLTQTSGATLALYASVTFNWIRIAYVG